MRVLRDIHGTFAYVAISLNAIAGIVALVAWRVPRLRGRVVWIVTIVAEIAILLQVVMGAILVSSKDYTVSGFHMFYGFLAFLTVGFAYQYRFQMRGKREMLYGLVGLFIMGLGIRAVLQAT
jgi:hypothetical protein